MAASTALEVAFVGIALITVVWLVCAGIDRYISQRERVLESMFQFGRAFIREFERPLIDPSLQDAPVRTRLRARPDRGRLEILLAPKGSHRYPNLSDHRTNLTYDIERVLAMMDDPSFLCGNLYARGRWVVVPFRRQLTPQQAGDR